MKFKTPVVLSLLSLFSIGESAAHGINGHVHVTGWAVESLPDGDLRSFFASSRLRDIAQIGASFPDSGYAIGDGYGEIAHWEPFIQGYLSWLIERHGPDFASDEAQAHLAFLMGAASHGLQDEIFDSTFLYATEQHDGRGQDETDPGTDAFLFTDGHLSFLPPVYLPAADLVEVFQTRQGHEVSEDTLAAGMARIHFFVLESWPAIAPTQDSKFRAAIPWAAAHYMDPDVTGSLRSEVPATLGYLEALFMRAHGRFSMSDLVRHVYPSQGRRLSANDPALVESFITVVLGQGCRVGSANTDTVKLLDEAGLEVPLTVTHTRWTTRADDFSRLIQLRPAVELRPDAEYEIHLLPGLELQDGRVLDVELVEHLRSACEPNAQGCTPYFGAGPADPVRRAYPPEPPQMDPPEVGARDGGLAALDAATAPADVVTPTLEPSPRSSAGGGCTTTLGLPALPFAWLPVAALLAARRARRSR